MIVRKNQQIQSTRSAFTANEQTDINERHHSSHSTAASNGSSTVVSSRSPSSHSRLIIDWSLWETIPLDQRIPKDELINNFDCIQFDWHQHQNHAANRSVSGSGSGSIVAGLLYHRNSASWLPQFAFHHSALYDFLIILDDASDSPQSPEQLFSLVSQHAQQWKLAVYLHRRQWIRMNEWYDRNLLILLGRQLGATHMAMLDIDEFVSANCLAAHRPNQLPPIRRLLDGLTPDRSLLELQWVELWGSPMTMRVADKNSKQNFLHINFIGIWFDVHGHINRKWITSGNALPNGGAAHVPRVPDWIREQNGKSLSAPADNALLTRLLDYARRQDADSLRSIQSDCSILHFRFINPDIFYLKGAWYEIRGIVHQLEEAIQNGKWSPAKAEQTGNGTARAADNDSRGALEGELAPAKLAQRSFDGIVGGAFKKAQSLPLYLAPVPSQWISQQFLDLYSEGRLGDLTPWRIEQVYDAIQRFGRDILKETRFAQWIDWDQAVKMTREGKRIQTLPRVLGGEAKQPKFAKE